MPSGRGVIQDLADEVRTGEARNANDFVVGQSRLGILSVATQAVPDGSDGSGAEGSEIAADEHG